MFIHVDRLLILHPQCNDFMLTVFWYMIVTEKIKVYAEKENTIMQFEYE